VPKWKLCECGHVEDFHFGVDTACSEDECPCKTFDYLDEVEYPSKERKT